MRQCVNDTLLLTFLHCQRHFTDFTTAFPTVFPTDFTADFTADFTTDFTAGFTTDFTTDRLRRGTLRRVYWALSS